MNTTLEWTKSAGGMLLATAQGGTKLILPDGAPVEDAVMVHIGLGVTYTIDQPKDAEHFRLGRTGTVGLMVDLGEFMDLDSAKTAAQADCDNLETQLDLKEIDPLKL